MDSQPQIVILGGGTSAEREVSLASSRAVYESLRQRHPARWVELEGDALPPGLDPQRDVIFPVLHGTFGEDGGLQSLMDLAGLIYVGCDAASSALCMDKALSKERAAGVGVPVTPQVIFSAGQSPSVDAVHKALGTLDVVVKPLREGSSVGLHFINGATALESSLANLAKGEWMIEPRLSGNDLTVGVLNGEPLGVVAILPKDGGAYDYAHKYTAGATDYQYPADLPVELTDMLRESARRVFQTCGCRDFARVDFFHGKAGFYFLEINTIPGLTATSLLPKSASCLGLDFDALVDAMIEPALQRFQSRSFLRP